MAMPVVAIVGRPNVGKSSLLNWLAGRRIAIVDPTAGVTRDRVATLVQGPSSHYFELVDTGGIGIDDADNLTLQVERQIEAAMDQAHVILMVVDGRTGLMPLDEEVARRLRYITKPIILVANKCDHADIDANTAEFYKLGRGKMVCVSAQQNRGKEALLRLIEDRLPDADTLEEPKEVALKLAIVGRRNTGKSTFINSLAESERMIVSEVPGTTRDSVDVRFERDGKTFIAIDTAGVRRKTSLGSDIEFYSMARAERSIRRADVVLIFLDPRVRISKVDKQLADYILQQHKPAIFVINKWDLMKPMPTGRMANYVRGTFPSLDYVPLAFITAKAGKNVHALVNLAQTIHKQSNLRVSTGDLNRVLRQAMDASPPPMRQNRRPKVFYATQVSTNPPTIVLFTNGPELFDNTYQRYLLKTFRDALPFTDIPIKLYIRKKSQDPAGAPDPTAAPRQKRPKKSSRPGVDLSFTTTLSEDDLQHFDDTENSELWKDL